MPAVNFARARSSVSPPLVLSTPVRCRSARRRASRLRFVTSFSRQSRSSSRIRGGTRAGSNAPVRLTFEYSRQNLGDSLRRRTPHGRSAFRRARIQTRKCRCVCRPCVLSPVPATCTPPFPESLPHSSLPCSASVSCERAAFAGFVLERLRQSEVEHLHFSVRRDLHIRGFQIPMDDSFLMRRFQCFADLLRNLQRFIDRNRPALDAFRQRFSFDKFHHQELAFAGFFQSVIWPQCWNDSATPARAASRSNRATRSLS